MLPSYRLIEAVKTGNQHDMRGAIADGATLDARDTHSLSLLEIAQKYCQQDAARFLLDLGAIPQESTTPFGNTLLHSAARAGNAGFARLWLDHGLDPAVSNRGGQAPIHLAVRGDQQYLIFDLLHHGASVDQTDGRGRTALMLAAKLGNSSMIRFLLTMGADPMQAGPDGYTAFHEAVAHGNDDACVALFRGCKLQPWEKQRLIPRLTAVAERHAQPAVIDTLAAESEVASHTNRASSPTHESVAEDRASVSR